MTHRDARAMGRLGGDATTPLINPQNPEFNKLNVRELKAQILQRKELLKQMVGTLYPSILSDQIDAIQERIEEL